ncbi:MAG: hypothetical protein ACXVWU_00900 [Nocardioides sp.]
MEGRALNREPGKQWAWIIPWFSGGVASVVGDATGAHRVSFFIIGVVAGVVWQVLFRRDLTSRLTLMAMISTVGLVAVLVSGDEFVWSDMNTGGLYAIGVLLGLIYTEQFQRWRDRVVQQTLSDTRDTDAGTPA